MRIRWVLLLSFLFSLVLTPFIKWLARRFNILDYPAERKVHKHPTPLLGGVAVYLAFLIPIFFQYIWLNYPYLLGLIIAATLVLAAGLLDDIKELSAGLRLLVQIIAAAMVIKSGIVLSFLPNTFWGNTLEIILTAVWIIGITNAMNCLDGIDGLAVTLTIIQGLCFLIIAYQSQQFLLGCLAAALMGSALGFLRYNFPPARIFLGDAGSTFLGFMLAVIAVMGNWAENNFVSIFVPVFILGIPIFDMILTTIMRIKEKKVTNILSWLNYTGKDHFHHRLLNLGFGPRSIIAFISAVSLSIGLSGILLKSGSISTALFMLLQAGIVLVLIGLLMIVSARKTKDV